MLDYFRITYKFWMFVLILAGLIVSLFVCMHNPLNCDTSSVGMAALAFRIDPLLTHIHFTALDPHTFTDLLVYVPVQLLSGCNPTILKLTGFAIAACIVAVLCYMVYWATGDKTKMVVPLIFVIALSYIFQNFLLR